MATDWPHRPELPQVIIEKVFADTISEFNHQLVKHGPGAAYSIHEIEGVCHEEMDEVAAEVHRNAHAKIRHELIQLAVAAIWGAATIDLMLANQPWSGYGKSNES